MSIPRRKIKLLFLGQCLQSGYEGVPMAVTYPSLAQAALSARFPTLNFILQHGMVFHPKGIKALLRYRLATFKPDIVVLTALATFTATKWQTGLIYELAPEVVVSARSFMQTIDAKLRSGTKFGKLLDRTLVQTHAWRPRTVHPPLQLVEYERLLEEGIKQCRQKKSRRVVLLGPGGFNEDTQMDFALQSPELWTSVNEMVISLGKRLKVPVINAQEALHEYSGEVYLPNEHKFSVFGQAVISREVEAVLADQVVALLSNRTEDLLEAEPASLTG